MSVTNFNTRNDTYRKLIGNGLTYRIPRFQRDYSWGEEEWEDLWHDILGTAEGKETGHYMGYLVLQSDDEKLFDVIDGQQRLTTLSIIVLAALRQLQNLINAGQDVENTRKRLDGLRQTYVGYLDPVTLVPRSKLSLNRNNDPYYQTYLVPLKDNMPKRGIKSSEHSLRKAFEYYDRRLGDYLKNKSDQGMAVAQLIDTMSDRLFFTVITVTDELNAYKVFETLNARGVRLSSTDLLKNYLFSVLHAEQNHEHELKYLDDRWEQIVSRLGAETFPDFLRVHWISRHNFVRQSELFKTIRSQIEKRADVFDLLSNIEDDIDTYLALTAPEGSDWAPKAKEYARNLQMFSVRQPFPLLIAAKRLLDDNDFETLLRAIMVISFRYNVIGNLQTSEQERTYHRVSEAISKKSIADLGGILNGLRAVYVSDDNFRTAFAEKSISAKQSRNRNIVKYILCHLEDQKGNTTTDYKSDKLSIEHICPINPQDNWGDFTDEDIETLPHRLGNMTLLSGGQNKDLGNATYSIKREAFRNSSYVITREVADHNAEWTPDRIAARQKSMANMATTIWRIAQLSEKQHPRQGAGAD